MSNHRLQLIPPYLQVRDEQGRWVTVIPDMGLPSGTNRTMRVDLTGKFLSQDRHVRIVTNLCVYWDQVFFTTDETSIPVAALEACPGRERRGPAEVSHPPCASNHKGGMVVTDWRTSTRELALVTADLHYRGFSTPASDPEHFKPDSFDYVHVLAEAPWNPMQGKYTRYGDVKALLRAADDRLVVMATGDELTVKFSRRDLPQPKPGWKRDFFLYLSGWAKDGEPNTAYSKTVEPLPFQIMSNYPYGPHEHAPDGPAYRHYLREYQTRPAYSLIVPLAPDRR
jgi:hypothetical protein